MKCYFAAGLGLVDVLRSEGARHVLIAFPELRADPQQLAHLRDLDVFLDCGAWSVASGVVAPFDVREYMAWLRTAKFPFGAVAALDVLGDAEATWRNYRTMRDAGFDDVIPTWHAEEPVSYAARYAEAAEYVAVGGLAARARSGRVMDYIAPAWPFFRNRRVHLFGVGAGSIVAVYRPHSVDQTTWIIGAKFGAVFSLTRWPSLRQVVISPRGRAFEKTATSGLVAEMRSYGATWRELATSTDARLRYNVRLMLDYMRRIEAVPRASVQEVTA